MKICFGLFFSFLLFSSCTKDPVETPPITTQPPAEDAIVKNWKSASIIFKVDNQEFSHAIDANTLGEYGNLNFLKDANFSYLENGNKKTGTWKWVEKNKKLELIDADKKTVNYDILNISATEFSFVTQTIDLTKTTLTQTEEEILNFMILRMAILGKNWEKEKTNAKTLQVILKFN